MSKKEYAIDIETVPDLEAAERFAEAHAKAPANYKDEKKIAAAIERSKAKIIDQAALHELTARIVAVGVADDCHGGAIAEKDERAVLERLLGMLEDTARVVTFNGRSFDLRVLRNRMLFHGLKVPAVLRPEGRYTQRRHVDVREILTDFDPRMSGTLEDWYRAIIGDPDGVIVPHEASEIQALAEEGYYVQIGKLASGDATATWHIYRRLCECGVIGAA